jgi:hypothetical protein
MDYTARCHCGRVRFSFRSSEIKSGKRCDCSLCVRRGAVLSWTYIPAADFTPHNDVGDLGVYLWNERVLSNYFCKTCGIFTYIGDGENAKDGYRVNLGCVEGLDPLGLEITIIDGKTLPLVGCGSPTEGATPRTAVGAINRHADALNAEGDDSATYQANWTSE